MRRVLMLSYYFPPLGGIASLRALGYARHLPGFGWEPTVVTPRNGAYHRDPSLAFDEARVIRTGSLELSRLGKRAIGSRSGDTRSAAAPAGLAGARDWVRRWVYRPDSKIGWYPFALQAARAHLRSQRGDVLFSSAYPVTAHLVARRLHREFGVPWVAEFRDAWTDLEHYDSPRRKRLDEATQRSIVSEANAIVTVSPRWAGLFSGHGARRVCLLTNGFEPLDFGTATPAPAVTAAFLGTYFPGRQDLKTTFRAFASLLREGRLPEVRLLFIGEAQAEVAALAAETGLEGRVEVTGFISHQESLRRLSGAAILLLPGPGSTDDGDAAQQGHIPAKVFEYLGAGRPILCVGHTESDVARLLRPLPGACVVAPGDVEGARSAILALMNEVAPQRGDLLAPYTRRALTGRLAELFDEVLR
jgi:glycosyltransferase involved in cell wall biosynthesis